MPQFSKAFSDAPELPPEVPLNYAPVSFSFPITWSLLTEPFAAPSPVPIVAEHRVAEVAAITPELGERLPSLDGALDTDQWEMVIPKMARPEPSDWPAPRFDLDMDKPRAPLTRKIALVAGLSAAGLAAAFYTGTGHPRPPEAPAPDIVVSGPALPVALAGWINDFAVYPSSNGASNGAPSDWVRRVSVMRGSLALTDFRMEFQAEIEARAMGWAFRVKDPRNYYVMRLEIVKAGPTNQMALQRFAVVDGQEQPRIQIPLMMAPGPDTIYQIRMDALGNRFRTWIQGQQVDEWVDDQLSAGGVGLYAERGEHSTLVGNMAVFPLTVKHGEGS